MPLVLRHLAHAHEMRGWPGMNFTDGESHFGGGINLLRKGINECTGRQSSLG